MRRLVLAGAGHAHARVLLELAKRSVANLEVLLISPVAQAPYSGMVPGWLAGHYRWEECCIDFAHLCRQAGASLRMDAVAGIDPQRKELLLASGARIPYDWLSLNIGSTLTPPDRGGLAVLPLRPLAAAHARWHALLDKLRQLDAGAAYRVLMVGGGAAGVESVLAAHRRLTQWAPQVRLQFVLATQDDTILPGMATGAARRLRQHLASRGIELVYRFSAERFEQESVVGSDGRALQADAVLWATGAQAYTWPAEAGLATDGRGFIRVDSALRSISHPNIFAAGDCVSWQPPLPKAGVYAVRMGPVLAHNLRAAVHDEPMQRYVPQRRYLVLIGTGSAHAVAAWGRWSWQGAWVWRWKQHIDRRFVERHNTL